MSALTKVFVILLVVTSLLLSAGIVVYVNKDQDYRKSNIELQSQIETNRLAYDRQKLDADAAQTALQSSLKTAQAQITEKQRDVEQHLASIVALNTQLATLSRDQSMATVEKTSLADALKAAQEQASKLQGELAAIRTRNNEILVQNADLNKSVSELTNKLDATERERKFLTEQVVQEQSQTKKLSGLLKDAGINPDTQAGPVANGAPPIRGVIRKVNSINNVSYATISVGSSDAVTQGMEFKVIDRQSAQFLGYLKIDSVEANEAIGRLDGPRISEIHTGSEVVTQIQG